MSDDKHIIHVTAEPVAEDAVWCDECEEWVSSGAPEGPSGDDLRDRVKSCPRHPFWSGMVWDCAFCNRAVAELHDLRDRVTALLADVEHSRSVRDEDPTIMRRDGVPADVGALLRAVLAVSPAPVVSRPETAIKAEALQEAADALSGAGFICDWLRDRAASLVADSEAGERS